MSETKYLNLDDLASAPKRVLTVGGKEHEMKEETVQDFIDLAQKLQKIDRDESSFVDQIELTIQVLEQSFPTVEKGFFRNLSPEKLNKVFEFTRGMMDESLQKEESPETPDEKKMLEK